MKVSLAADAELELLGAAQFYAREADAQLGLAFIAEFERSVELLRQHPHLGAKWRGSTRRLPLRRFPFSIVYVALASEVRVLAIAHQSRKPGYRRGRV